MKFVLLEIKSIFFIKQVNIFYLIYIDIIICRRNSQLNLLALKWVIVTILENVNNESKEKGGSHSNEFQLTLILI